MRKRLIKRNDVIGSGITDTLLNLANFGISIHESTLRRYVKDGTVKHEKVNGQIIIPNVEFNRLVKLLEKK